MTRDRHGFRVDAGPRNLAAFPENLSHYAHHALEELGVEVLINTRVEDIAEGQVRLAENKSAGTIVWGAGVKAAAGHAWLNAPADRTGRLLVTETLQVEGFEDIYAIGDIAAARNPDGTILPALAQVAKLRPNS